METADTRDARYWKNTALAKKAERKAEAILLRKHGDKLKRNGREYREAELQFWKDTGVTDEVKRIENAPDIGIGHNNFVEVKWSTNIAEDSYQECLRLHKNRNSVEIWIWRDKTQNVYIQELDDFVNKCFVVAKVEDLKFVLPGKNTDFPHTGLIWQPSRLPRAELEAYWREHGSANDFRRIDMQSTVWNVVTEET